MQMVRLIGLEFVPSALGPLEALLAALLEGLHPPASKGKPSNGYIQDNYLGE